MSRVFARMSDWKTIIDLRTTDASGQKALRQKLGSNSCTGQCEFSRLAISHLTNALMTDQSS